VSRKQLGHNIGCSSKGIKIPRCTFCEVVKESYMALLFFELCAAHTLGYSGEGIKTQRMGIVA